jgi:hypothetical protein
MRRTMFLAPVEDVPFLHAAGILVGTGGRREECDPGCAASLL